MFVPVKSSFGASGIDTGDIPASLRFRSAAPTYLSRTYGTPTTATKWTYSLWFKRGKLGSVQTLVSGVVGSGGCGIFFYSDDTLTAQSWIGGSYQWNLQTSRVFRDPNSWIHLVVAYDSTQATASDRVKLYINGVQQTALSIATYPSLNVVGQVGGVAGVHRIGYRDDSLYPFDGYLSRVVFLDGVAAQPTDFIRFNSDTNEYVSKTQSEVLSVVNSGGNNSFCLDSDDASSLTALGYSKSTVGFTNWASGGTPSASSNIGGYGPERAFDGSTATQWINSVAGGTAYLRYTKAAGSVAVKYEMSGRDDAPANERAPNSWVFQGSNDGTNWTTIDTQSGITWATGSVETKSFTVTNTVSYTYYQLANMVQSDPADYVTLYEFKVFKTGNDWVSSGHSLTAGVTYDHMKDSPSHTNGGSYAVINPLANPAGFTISNGNLKAIKSGGNGACFGTPDFPSGKWVFAIKVDSAYSGIGVSNNYDTSTNGLGFPAGQIGFQSGAIYNQGTYITAGIPSLAAGDVAVCCFDAVNGIVYFGKQTGGTGSITWLNSSDPVAGTGGYTGFTSGSFRPAFNGALGNGVEAFFGQQGFTFADVTGFLALCQDNRPDPAILNPKKHFDVLTRSGTGATANITSYQFDPDFVWIKNRGSALSHCLFDRNRGALNRLSSNSTSAEDSPAGTLTTFATNGYTLGSDAGIPNGVNGSSNTYVDWVWKAGGAGVSNTAGTITSTVSANVEAGFSIVTYTGTGANATVGHGLGVAPKFVVVKKRVSTGAGNYGWYAYHKNLTSAAYSILLSDTAAQSNTTTMWNSTDPTTTVFSVGTSNGSNESGQTYVAYCFAEISGYSKIGSYVGSGSVVYVDCGFKARRLMIKNATTGNTSWLVWDSARNTYNVMRDVLAANSSAAELNDSTKDIDVTAYGFVVRGSNSDINTNGNSYIFYAIADVAGKYALAR